MRKEAPIDCRIVAAAFAVMAAGNPEWPWWVLIVGVVFSLVNLLIAEWYERQHGGPWGGMTMREEFKDG